ncbi:efflux RND transporter periplasmic adaptor subunit [Pontibacter sp. G13]|uniref:efflux RND transporter periplasmic adaptor subunit n=1 Tax=Pontibacter sp. G13 TaxID=3074898 RepID=UPI00288AE900|nr:efflux RND transporter periplasmic adaptor subunit [Pontibacter sp. G13]WNJ20483.1 efflux RND transporter periplasmic adaptor subunit [Pontibacter sp. G13]
MWKNLTYTLGVPALAALAACTPTSGADETPDLTTPRHVPVRIAKIQPSIQPIPILASGIVAAREEINLSFKTGGIIQKTFVREGQRVKKGQLLATLNLAEIDAQVKQAQASVTKSQRDLQRLERLYADSVATLEQVQDLRTALEVSEANLRIASFNQSQSKIVAPTSGRILRKLGETGEIISPGMPVYRLASDRNAQVIRTGLSDVDIVQVKMGDQAKIRFDAWPQRTFEARVTEIAAGAHPVNGTYEVELSLDKTDLPIKNGFIGHIQLFPSDQESQVLIPIAAMVEGYPDSVKLYVLDESKTHAQPHTVHRYEIRSNQLAIPTEELEGHEQVITEGAKYLQPGTAIDIVPKTPQVSESNIANR